MRSSLSALQFSWTPQDLDDKAESGGVKNDTAQEGSQIRPLQRKMQVNNFTVCVKKVPNESVLSYVMLSVALVSVFGYSNVWRCLCKRCNSGMQRRRRKVAKRSHNVIGCTVLEQEDLGQIGFWEVR